MHKLVTSRFGWFEFTKPSPSDQKLEARPPLANVANGCSLLGKQEVCACRVEWEKGRTGLV